MRVVLVGGTGLVGSLLAPHLLRSGHELHMIQRRAGGSEPNAAQVHVERPEAWADLVRGLAPEAAISTLGTTIRKAGSEAGFRAVDHDLVVQFAAAACAAGARRMLTVSSVGADERSRQFYLRLKGQVDAQLARLGFGRLDIVRPGLLRGSRGADRRFGERMGIWFSPLTDRLLPHSLARYRAIEAADVAAAIAAMLDDDKPGRFVHENEALKLLARRFT